MSGSHIELRDDGIYVGDEKIPGIVLENPDVVMGRSDEVNHLVARIAFDTITDKRERVRRTYASNFTWQPSPAVQVLRGGQGGSGGLPTSTAYIRIKDDPDDGTPIPA